MRINRPQRVRGSEKTWSRIFFFSVLIFAVFTAASAQTDTRVSATWEVQKYDINATLPPSDLVRTMSVKAHLDLKNVSSGSAGTLTLRISPNAEIASIAVNGNTVDFSKREEKIGTGSLQQLVVRMPTVVAGATFSITADYKLNVKDNSGLAAISAAGSQFLPLSFWYPTPNSWFFTRGADYAPSKIQVTASGQTVVSSGTEAGGSFETKLDGQPFFIAGNFELVQANGVSVYVPRGADANEKARAAELAGIAAEARTFYEPSLPGKPDAPIRLVAVKRGAGFAQGGVILFDESVLRRPKLDAQTVVNIADGIAKIWIGGSIPVSGDGAGAIRQGLTKYFATQFIENKFGKDIADLERLRQRVAYSSVVERDSPINTVSPLDDYYYSVVANKGAMIWRLLAKKLGSAAFDAKLMAALGSGATLADLRNAFADQKTFLDNAFDQVTDTNLQIGLPQLAAGEAKVALRNTGSVDVTADVTATLENGQTMSAPATIRAKSFGEIIFKTTARISKVEIDKDKLYPQTDYSDDVAPRERTESDPLLAAKRAFDKQEYAATEKTAREILSEYPRFDEVRILLARSLVNLGRTSDAEKEFRAVLDEKLPSSRSISWALVGLADVAARNGQNEAAINLATASIRADADYGASLAARAIRKKAGSKESSDASITAYFAEFDKAAQANQKAAVDALVMPGEAVKFASGVAGQTVEWKTQVGHIDMLDANTALVETELSVKLLNRDPTSGTAVYRLMRSGSSWKLYNVDVFEVR